MGNVVQTDWDCGEGKVFLTLPDPLGHRSPPPLPPSPPPPPPPIVSPPPRARCLALRKDLPPPDKAWQRALIELTQTPDFVEWVENKWFSTRVEKGYFECGKPILILVGSNLPVITPYYTLRYTSHENMEPHVTLGSVTFSRQSEINYECVYSIRLLKYAKRGPSKSAYLIVGGTLLTLLEYLNVCDRRGGRVVPHHVSL